MIVCGQAAHIWVCRTTTVSIFQHGVFSNRVTNIGVVVALLLGCFVTYTPGMLAAFLLSFKSLLLYLAVCLLSTVALSPLATHSFRIARYRTNGQPGLSAAAVLLPMGVLRAMVGTETRTLLSYH
jgi:hypothetical protein